MVEKKLSGKVALVTGGARGIGRGCALRLAKLGADIAIIDRNLKGFEVYEFEKKQMAASTVMDEGRALGVKAMGLEVDLADRAATGTAIDEIVKKMGFGRSKVYQVLRSLIEEDKIEKTGAKVKLYGVKKA